MGRAQMRTRRSYLAMLCWERIIFPVGPRQGCGVIHQLEGPLLGGAEASQLPDSLPGGEYFIPGLS